MYMPTANCPFRSSTQLIENRRGRLLSAVFGRLKPGVEVAQAQADIAGVATNLTGNVPGRLSKTHRLRRPARATR